jgi:HlyD family secretion protein
MKKKRAWLIVIVVLGLVGLFAVFGLNRHTAAQHFTAKVERGGIDDVVEATGTINAVITVQVGSQVSGTITKLNVDFNSRVHKGDVIALIDPALFKGALLQAEADLQNADANVVAARAALEKAEAAVVQAKADYDRAVNLTREGVTSRQQLDQAKMNYDSAKASEKAAAASITQAQAQASQKRAAVTVAQTNLDYTVIRSPINGTVVARNVDVGQTVAASLQAPTIFTIAQDLKKMWVYAKTDESDVGNIKEGKPVTFKVDAFPKETFRGTVSQVRMNATTVQSVVTYDTIIEFENPDLKLFPGMTAYATIPVASVQKALKIPNTALRYKPPMSAEEILAIYKERGIGNGGSSPADVSTATSTRPASATQSGPGTPKSDVVVVWKLRPDKSIEPVELAIGITDHAFTEVNAVLKGDLKEGDDVIIRSVVAKQAALSAIRR